MGVIWVAQFEHKSPKWEPGGSESERRQAVEAADRNAGVASRAGKGREGILPQKPRATSPADTYTLVQWADFDVCKAIHL